MIHFISGCVLGGIVGYVAACLCAAAKKSDNEKE